MHTFSWCYCHGLRVPRRHQPCQTHFSSTLQCGDSQPFPPCDPLLQHENKPFQDFPPICSPRRVVITADDSSWAVTCLAACTRTGEWPLCPPAHSSARILPSSVTQRGCHQEGSVLAARLSKQGCWKLSCSSARWLQKGPLEECGHQSPGRFATSAFMCCAGLAWNTPLWAGSSHSSSPQKGLLQL